MLTVQILRDIRTCNVCTPPSYSYAGSYERRTTARTRSSIAPVWFKREAEADTLMLSAQRFGSHS